jgi:hypothetical protein
MFSTALWGIPRARLKTGIATVNQPMGEPFRETREHEEWFENEQWVRDFVSFVRSENTHVFFHHIYEYKKGLRNLILHTTAQINETKIRAQLERKQIAYVIYPLGRDKINVFFGESICIEVVRKIGKTSLSDYTDEEDFMLGIMLGYDRKQQCERYLQRKDNQAREQLIG